MRLLSFKSSGDWLSPVRVGAETELGIVDLHLASLLRFETDDRLPIEVAQRFADALVPTDMTDFVAGGERTLTAARESLEWVASNPGAASRARFDADGILRLPVVPKPPLIRDFMGFEKHLSNIYPRLGREIPPEWYELPIYYKGNPQSVGAHGEDIAIPSYSDEMDFEFEIAAVIGRGGMNIPRDEAMSHIYGFTIYNDFSARDIQRREMAVGLGPAKGKDFNKAHVFGPCLVTIDEIGDIYEKRTEGRVNGEVWSSGRMSDMHWRFEDMIAHASMDETLHSGEILGSGTVGDGSAAERGEKLKPGDRVELYVEGIGTLVNRVISN